METRCYFIFYLLISPHLFLLNGTGQINLDQLSNRQPSDEELYSKITSKEKKNLGVLIRSVQALNSPDKEGVIKRLMKLLVKEMKKKPEERKLSKNRKLLDLSTVLMGLGGAAVGLLAMKFLTGELELSNLKTRWMHLQNKLSFARAKNNRNLERLGSDVAAIQNEVGIFQDQMFTKATQLRVFVDSKVIY